MAVPSQEATIKHLVAVYPFATKYTRVKNAFEAHFGAGSLAGMCFSPMRTGEAATAGNYQNAIQVTFVRWTAPVSPGDVSTISFTTVGDIPTLNVPESSTLSDDDFMTDMVEIDNLSGWDLFRHYHDISEVEYAFIDKHTFEYLADSNTFYPSATPTGFVSGFPARGLLISRAFITMQGGSAGNNYKKFRALRMAPYPEPQLSTSPTRPSISYYLGPICPPYWDNTGDEFVSDLNTDGNAGGIAPVMMATITERQVVNPSKGEKDCNCVVNKINMALLHQELIAKGIISKNPPPPYRFRLWPWILLLFLAASLMIFGGIKAVQTISKKDNTEKQVK